MNFAELTSGDLSLAFQRDVAVLLPTGSVEQHGPHLPVGTDGLIAERLALAAAGRLADECVVLPTLWYGFSPHHMSFPGTVTVAAGTYLRLVAEIAESLYAHGVRRLVILNGHGGNSAPLKMIAAELARAHGKSPSVVTYWDLIAAEAGDFFEEPELVCGHACALETSLALHLFPEAVRRELIPERSGETGPHMFGRAGPAEGLDFRNYSSNGVIGDPSLATADLGRRLFDLIIERLVRNLSPGSPGRVGPGQGETS
ncbi:MAG: creatininase family protein [Chloroflexi bacterium]|nr:MAG: creatininase family protein [Chloroflexota bacterium]